MSVRLIAASLVVALALAGPFQPVVLAEQTTQPDTVKKTVKRSKPPQVGRGVDLYDVGGVFLTVLGLPFKTIVCVAGGVLGVGLYIVTFGSADRGAAAVVREGCDQNWIVSGNDIRPDSPSSRAIEWDRYELRESR